MMEAGTAPGIGKVGHIAYVVDDVRSAMALHAAGGTRWCELRRPTAVLRLPRGDVIEAAVDYVAARGGEPRLKLISRAPGTIFDGPPANHVHHLSYWVHELDAPTDALVAAGWRIEADGIAEDGTVSYRYLVTPDGMRIELGLERNRAAFDEWADGTSSV